MMLYVVKKCKYATHFVRVSNVEFNEITKRGVGVVELIRILSFTAL